MKGLLPPRYPEQCDLTEECQKETLAGPYGSKTASRRCVKERQSRLTVAGGPVLECSPVSVGVPGLPPLR